MCDPTLAMASINAASSFAGISQQNDAAAANARNAKIAANNQFEQADRQYIEESRSIMQAGMDMVLQGREAESKAYTSAIQNGVQGASVRAMMRDKSMTATRNKNRNEQELDSLRTSVEDRKTNIRQKTKARIASVPSTSFGVGDAVGILSPIAKYGSDTLGVNGLGD